MFYNKHHELALISITMSTCDTCDHSEEREEDKYWVRDLSGDDIIIIIINKCPDAAQCVRPGRQEMRDQSYVKITSGAADQIEYKYYLGVAPPSPVSVM